MSQNISPLPRSHRIALNNTLTSTFLDTFPHSSPYPTFVYGSLMFPNLLSAILQPAIPPEELALRMTPAILKGYTRYAVAGVSYPAILPSDNESDEVRGMLIVKLTEEQKRRLDRFERGGYEVKSVEVWVDCEVPSKGPGEGGEERVVKADAYVWRRGVDELVPLKEKLWTVEGYLEDREMGRGEG